MKGCETIINDVEYSLLHATMYRVYLHNKKMRSGWYEMYKAPFVSALFPPFP